MLGWLIDKATDIAEDVIDEVAEVPDALVKSADRILTKILG